MKRTIGFTVQGKGKFPYDMLRYDTCYPINPSSTYNIEADARESRTVRLAVCGSRPNSFYPTVERWRSFGWDVTEVITEVETTVEQVERVVENV